MIYLDNSATTRPCEAAVAAMTEALTEGWGNPSSLHDLGLRADAALRSHRRAVSDALGAEEERVFFTSGGTEADNWAIFSTVERLKKRGKHIITTAVEHHAVLHPMEKLAAQGYDVTFLKPDRSGVVPLADFTAALRPDTILVSVMMVNNESGAVMPIADMIRATRRKSPLALFHTDAVQGFGKIPFQAKRLGADLITVSAHKIHGPKGVGALYIRKGVNLPPLLVGGGEEGGYRSGTEAMPAIAGFAAACAHLDIPAEIAHLTALRDACREALSAIDGVELLAAGDAPHIVAASAPGLRSQGLINCLKDRGVYVSAGSACAKGHRSHVFSAMGLPPAAIDGAIRISFSRENTFADIDALVEALRAAQGQLR